jgi:hypothetical protein
MLLVGLSDMVCCWGELLLLTGSTASWWNTLAWPRRGQGCCSLRWVSQRGFCVLCGVALILCVIVTVLACISMR